ncbi:MAG: sulfite exporter TauE/SafE family protein [Polyangiaceae bacterium]|jgi:uncharacterized membrane protein YfcA
MGFLDAKKALLGLLALVGTAFVWFWGRALREDACKSVEAPSAYEVAVGVITDFLDTLGIGSFATTMSLYKIRRTVPDRVIPGTLNVGHTLPTLAQAFIYVAIVRVDITTLASMIASAVLGAGVGAGFVARWPKRRVQMALAAALFGAAALLLAQELRFLPKGGDTLGLRGHGLAVGIIGNLALGSLMTIGIGLYAPCMILVSLLGMSPAAAFPIMMGSCAFLMPVAGVRFMRASAYAPRAALGLTIGGLPAVLAAALVVRSLPLEALRWLVLAVVILTACAMARTAARIAPD